jgi:hypothetical protein
MSDINVKGCVLFEQELVQKIVVIQYTLVNNTVLQIQWIIIYCIHCYKNNCSFYQNNS